MSVNLKYQNVSHFAFLPALRVEQVVCATSPPRAYHLPPLIAVYLSLLGQRHYPYQLVCSPALVEEQLRLLQMYRTFYFCHSP